MATSTSSRNHSATAPPWVAALSDDALREAAGQATFDRGLAYANEGKLEMVDLTATSATFDVRGSRRYAVDLAVQGGELDATCDCWQATGGRFCKHTVAAVLLWRQQLGGGDLPLPAPPSAEALAAEEAAQERKAQAREKAAQTRASKREALLAFLQQQPADALAQLLWQRASTDRDLLAELQAWQAMRAAAAAGGDARTMAKAVDALLAVSRRQFLEPRDVRAWAGRATQAVALLRAALPQQGEPVRTVAEHAVQVSADVQRRAFDNPDEVQPVIDDFLAVLADALRAAPPPAEWGERLLNRIRGEPYGPWRVDSLLAAAGPEAQRGYSRALGKAWKTFAEMAPRAALPGKRSRDDDVLFALEQERQQVRNLVLQDLQRQDDPQAVFDFMQRTAQGELEHAALIRWCSAHGRAREALQLARQARKQFPRDTQIETLLLEAYQRDGWDEEALAMLQQRFDKLPSVHNYAALLQAAHTAKADLAAVRQTALARAQAVEEAEFRQCQQRPVPWFGEPAPRGRDVSQSVALLLHDGQLAAALALVQPPHVCSPALLEALADQLPAAQDAEAAVLLERCFQAQMPRAQTPYTDVLRVVGKLLSRLDPAQARARRFQLAAEHKAKRNFVAGLPVLA